jgi:nitroreductase
MDVYEALYTTRAMRRCRPDPIPQDVQARILDAAIRAPSGGNTQNWRFMLVDDPDVRGRLGPIYRQCMTQLWATVYKDRLEAANAAPDEPDNAEMLKIQRSAQHLADHFEEYPLLLFSFVQFDPSGGSIFPATWSAMLAARAEGVGASLTSVFFQLDGARDPRRAEGRRLVVLVVRDVRYPTGVGRRRRAVPSGVPQPLGRAARHRHPRTALARAGCLTATCPRTRWPRSSARPG